MISRNLFYQNKLVVDITYVPAKRSNTKEREHSIVPDPPCLEFRCSLYKHCEQAETDCEAFRKYTRSHKVVAKDLGRDMMELIESEKGGEDDLS